MAPPPELVCPRCRVPVLHSAGCHRCPECRRTYPEVAGIPDFRLDGDRYLSLEEDRAKAERLADRTDLSFAELVEEYWRMTPKVPPALAARYARTAIDGVRRGIEWLAGLGPPGPGDAVLDVGCGTGGLVVACCRAGAVATGVDIALRWLVVARRLCEEQGVQPRLVAADGALLPFRGGSFDHTFSLETVEHAADQRGLLQSALLSVRPSGSVHVVVANRFTLGPDPAVRVFGVGYLPRRLAVRYVRRRRHTGFAFVRPPSPAELRALVGPRGDVAVEPGPLPPPPLAASPLRIAVDNAYERLRSSRAARPVLTWIAPFLEVSGRVRWQPTDPARARGHVTSIRSQAGHP